MSPPRSFGVCSGDVAAVGTFAPAFLPVCRSAGKPGVGAGLRGAEFLHLAFTILLPEARKKLDRISACGLLWITQE
jgi:hypothetical protein